MEVFNVHRRDVLNFDNWMDLKKPGFGGPNSAKQWKNSKGNFVNKDRKLEGYQHTAERHDAFKNNIYDPTYKAMGGDKVHQQDVGNNPYDYVDTYDTMGLPVAKVGKAVREGKCVDFVTFLFESAAEMEGNELCEECNEGDDLCEECNEDGEVNEKKWIKNAIKKPGKLRRELGKKEGEKISQSEIEAEKKKLDTDKSKPGVQTKSKSDFKKLLRLNLAKTLKKIHK